MPLCVHACARARAHLRRQPVLHHDELDARLHLDRALGRVEAKDPVEGPEADDGALVIHLCERRMVVKLLCMCLGRMRVPGVFQAFATARSSVPRAFTGLQARVHTNARERARPSRCNL